MEKNLRLLCLDAVVNQHQSNYLAGNKEIVFGIEAFAKECLILVQTAQTYNHFTLNGKELSHDSNRPLVACAILVGTIFNAYDVKAANWPITRFGNISQDYYNNFANNIPGYYLDGHGMTAEDVWNYLLNH